MPNLLTNRHKPMNPPITASTGDYTYWLVESHLGGVSFMVDQPDDDSLYCDQCGDMDTVYGPVDVSNPIEIIRVARDAASHTLDWPMPWDYYLDQYVASVDWTLHMLWDACKQTDPDVHWNMPAIQWLFRRELTAFWAVNGLAPFNRQRCVNYYLRLTRQEYAREQDTTSDPNMIAQRLLALDWMIMSVDQYGDEPRLPYGPMMPTPYLGCLLEARMRIIPQYRDQWLTMIEQYEPLQWVEPTENYATQHPLYALRPHDTSMRMAYIVREPDDEEYPSRPFKRVRNNRKRHTGFDLMSLLTAAI